MGTMNFFVILIFYAVLGNTAAFQCFECHGTSVSAVTSSCSESVNSEHARFVSLTECTGSCSITVLNHTSIGLRDFTRTCEDDCKNGCFDTPFGTKLCKYCCSSHRCNDIVPNTTPAKHTNSTSASTENFRLWLKQHLSKPRHHTVGPSIKFHIRHELTKLFREFVPNVEQQEVEISEAHLEDQSPEHFRSFIRTTSRGFNIISVAPGSFYKTNRDEIIVVMAHYDTSSSGTPGVDDNGSGVAALLELARLLGHNECERHFSIIFVATDFKEHGVYRATSKSGSEECLPLIGGLYSHNVGSSHFVCQWLVPHLKQYGGKLSLAVNLDSLLNVVDRSSNDVWPESVRQTLKNNIPNGINFWKAIKRKGFSSDWWMMKASANAFSKIFSIDVSPFPSLKSDDFLYLQMDTSAKNTRTGGMLEFLHSDDCAPFHEVSKYNLPCVTISDTGNMRGYMKRCQSQNCDNMEHVDDEKLENLAKLTNILRRFLTTLSETRCNNTEEDGFSHFIENAPKCDAPLIERKQGSKVFVSATCSRAGSILEMCPTIAGGIWGIVNGDSAWIPRKQKLGKTPLWFQVDFGSVFNVTSVAVQGVRRRGYVRSYMVSYSNNERDWEWHIPTENQWDDSTRRVEFRGSTSGGKIEKRPINPSISARFVRIYPRWWRKRIALRVQMYGCEA